MTDTEESYIQTDDGLFWFNAETNKYEAVVLLETEPVEPQLEPVNNISTAASAESSTVSAVTNKNVWDEGQTLLLLELCTKYKHELENPRLKKMEIYKKIAKDLDQYHYTFTWLQCQNRMKTLLTKYKEVKDHNNTSGKEAKKWRYFELMVDFIGDRPNITPTAGLSSFALSKQHDADAEASSSSNSSAISSDKAAKRKRVIQSPRQNMLRWLEKQSEEERERERGRLEVAERHHQENKELLKELIAVMKATHQ